MKNHLRAAWLVLVILFLSNLSCSTKPQDKIGDARLADLPTLIEKQMADWRVPGAAIGIVKDGKVIFARGFGYRDLEKKLPVTTKTLFPIASCTKAFTALAAEMAAEDGTLDLDKPIKDYIPDFRLKDEKAAAEATLRDFLGHRSGLSDYRFMPWLSGLSRDKIFQRLTYFEPYAEFRQKFIYSNLGYAMAGHVVERASGKAWEKYTAQNIFKPLGMKNACFTLEDMMKTGNYAQPYINLLDPEPKRESLTHMIAFAPCGGIITDIEGMLAWVKFHLNDGKVGRRQVIPVQRMHEMRTPHTKFKSDEELFTDKGGGYGWFVEKYRGFPHVYAGGLGNGYISQVSFLPEQKIGVVVLTNLYYQHFEEVIIYEIFDLLLGLTESDHHARNLKGVNGFADNWRKDWNAFWQKAGTDNLSPKNLDTYVGTYANSLYGQVSVGLNGEALNLTFESGICLPLRKNSADTFATDSDRIDFSHFKVSFEVSEDGKVVAFTVPLEPGIKDFRFTRLRT